MWLLASIGALLLMAVFVAAYMWGYQNGRGEIREMLHKTIDELRDFE
jgi:uncharacterized protein YggT (Ycf19 family)